MLVARGVAILQPVYRCRCADAACTRSGPHSDGLYIIAKAFGAHGRTTWRNSCIRMCLIATYMQRPFSQQQASRLLWWPMHRPAQSSKNAAAQQLLRPAHLARSQHSGGLVELVTALAISAAMWEKLGWFRSGSGCACRTQTCQVSGWGSRCCCHTQTLPRVQRQRASRRKRCDRTFSRLHSLCMHVGQVLDT